MSYIVDNEPVVAVYMPQRVGTRVHDGWGIYTDLAGGHDTAAEGSTLTQQVDTTRGLNDLHWLSRWTRHEVCSVNPWFCPPPRLSAVNFRNFAFQTAAVFVCFDDGPRRLVLSRKIVELVCLSPAGDRWCDALGFVPTPAPFSCSRGSGPTIVAVFDATPPSPQHTHTHTHTHTVRRPGGGQVSSCLAVCLSCFVVVAAYHWFVFLSKFAVCVGSRKSAMKCRSANSHRGGIGVTYETSPLRRLGQLSLC